MKIASFATRTSLCLVALLMLLTSPLKVLAISQDDLDSIKNGTPFYDPNASPGGCQPSGTTVSSNLPASVPEPHKTLFTNAANAFGTNPQFVTALFLTENGNALKPFDSQWGTSGQPPDAKWADGKVGARGPFQFEPGTWDGNKTDGNNDGVMDPDNIYDAAFSAAKLLSSYGAKANTPLGDINKPFVPGKFLYYAAAYNWGGGNLQKNTTASSPLSVAPKQTQNYLNNIYGLITSGFTISGYGNPAVPAAGTNTSAAPSAGSGCSGSVVAGSIVQTALNLAWNTRGHGPDEKDAKPSYQTAMPQYNGSTGDQPFSDCGVFVATVMRATGADPNYPKRNTGVQLGYLRQHPEKYTLLDNINSTSGLQPGDILIYADLPTGHTYIYVGNQSGGYNSVSASLHDHVPEASNAYFVSDNGNHFTVARLKK
ncbi:MAG TPA: hypothetical protein VLG37_03430 [Candidatus Saccharimonadales bacterium]|nr:hypothetical protein [Candidatus Saccharimonadales bacterium]